MRYNARVINSHSRSRTSVRRRGPRDHRRWDGVGVATITSLKPLATQVRLPLLCLEDTIDAAAASKRSMVLLSVVPTGEERACPRHGGDTSDEMSTSECNQGLLLRTLERRSKRHGEEGIPARSRLSGDLS